MPKIVRFQKIGGPEVLKIEEVPPAEPGAGEVRIKVQALGLNRAESMFYRGQYIYAPKLPSGLGYEAAGVVEAAGPGVDRSWVGKQVSTVPAFSMLDYSILGDEIIAPVSALASRRSAPVSASVASVRARRKVWRASPRSPAPSRRAR